MRTKEHGRRVRDKVLEKFKVGLSHKTISHFEHLIALCSIHHLLETNKVMIVQLKRKSQEVHVNSEEAVNIHRSGTNGWATYYWVCTQQMWHLWMWLEEDHERFCLKFSTSHLGDTAGMVRGNQSESLWSKNKTIFVTKSEHCLEHILPTLSYGNVVFFVLFLMFLKQEWSVKKEAPSHCYCGID